MPMKWGTDSGGCGPTSESQTQAKAMMRDVCQEGGQHHSIGDTQARPTLQENQGLHASLVVVGHPRKLIAPR